MTLVRLDTTPIKDWDTFHTVFAETFGFPDFYGRNRNAWIDCMSSLDAPQEGMTSVHTPEGSVVVLQLEDMEAFALRCPEQFDLLVECTAFVNWRRINGGQLAILALSYCKNG